MDSTNSSNQNFKSGRKYQELDSIAYKLWKRTDRFLIYGGNGTEVFIITNSDEVLAFGCNSWGRLGFGHQKPVKEPKIIHELRGKNVKDIKCGFGFSVALTQSGQIYTFGSNELGCTGNGDNKEHHKPIPIPVDNQLIAAIDCTDFSTHLLTQTGQLYWFGYSVWNRSQALTPTKVVVPSDTKVKSISCGTEHIFALTVDGKVFSWGDNSYGQLGLGHKNGAESPQIIDFGENFRVKQISCGNFHSLILTSDGSLYSMGRNYFGQFGIGNKVNKTIPQLVLSEQKEICCYRDISMSIDVNEKLYVWGDIGNGVLSPYISKLTSFQEVVNTFVKYRSTLKPIKRISSLTKRMINAFNNPKNSDLKFKVKCSQSDTQFKYIYCHKWFIKESSEYFQKMFANNWSENTSNEIQITSYSFEAYYQYIRSLYTDSIDCKDIEILSIIEEFTSSSNSNQNLKSDRKYRELDSIDFMLWKITDRFLIITDRNGTEVFLITNSDDVFAFGRSYGGRLGFGDKKPVKEPTIIHELRGKNVKDIKCGSVFSVALTESGQIYTFGSNKFGSTGNGDNRKHHKPILIPVDNQFIAAIDCMGFSTYLLTQTGQLYWFGYSFWNKSQVSTPTKVVFPFNTKVKSISCGWNHIFALTIDRRAFSWGDNSFGQLGLGHNNHTNRPQIIDLGENVSVKQISCGLYHSLILTSNGSLYSMGENNFGQLGIGNKSDQIIPQLVLSEQNEICCYRDISMSIDVNNKLYVWGNIGNGVLSPNLSELTSFQEVVNTFAEYRSTLKPIERIISLTKRMINAFNNPKNSDLKFKVKCSESDTQFKYIYCHKWFIEESAEHFKTMFANNWLESTTNEIEITSHSFEAYYQYIKSLYTDSIDCEDIGILLEILSITEEYMDWDTKEDCVELIKELANIENICSVILSANKYRSESLKQFCFEMMSKSMNDLIDRTDFKCLTAEEPTLVNKLYEYYIRSH